MITLVGAYLLGTQQNPYTPGAAAAAAISPWITWSSEVVGAEPGLEGRQAIHSEAGTCGSSLYPHGDAGGAASLAWAS